MPFGELTPEVRALDTRYAEAIRAVAGELWGDRGQA
ncbi:hypothetical protein [Dactylosporangium roseum]